MRRLLNWLGIACVAFWPLWCSAQDASAGRWEKAISAFEEQDRRQTPAPGGNLFVGSSSVRLWDLKSSFGDRPCLNRGFGGSRLDEVAEVVDRVVIPYRPKVVVLYAGDNDVAAGRTPQQVLEAYRSFVAKVHAALPETRIVWIAIKPSGARWKLREQAQAANALVRKEIAAGSNQIELDFWNAMLGENGEPRPELYVKDKLHLSVAGYQLWNERVWPLLATAPQDVR